MLNIPPAVHGDIVSIQVLKQISWFQEELAKAEQRRLDEAEFTSIRSAILKSIEELRILYDALQ